MVENKLSYWQMAELMDISYAQAKEIIAAAKDACVREHGEWSEAVTRFNGIARGVFGFHEENPYWITGTPEAWYDYPSVNACCYICVGEEPLFDSLFGLSVDIETGAESWSENDGDIDIERVPSYVVERLREVVAAYVHECGGDRCRCESCQKSRFDLMITGADLCCEGVL